MLDLELNYMPIDAMICAI
ncbi:hypothetical protein F383_25406 [Gossypium arboreum]|uniref:Uncharacterized protein n=1 Tax=Gossypium arboreum TaxID=29729 RepID=A0A0B0MR96_GOSAR|nr:hypothetical protein F383_25406 [Gossypium arboreum]